RGIAQAVARKYLLHGRRPERSRGDEDRGVCRRARGCARNRRRGRGLRDAAFGWPRRRPGAVGFPERNSAMKLSDYVIDFLVEHGVKHVFMLPGGGAMHLNDSLGKRRNEI